MNHVQHLEAQWLANQATPVPPVSVLPDNRNMTLLFPSGKTIVVSVTENTASVSDHFGVLYMEEKLPSGEWHIAVQPLANRINPPPQDGAPCT